MSRANRSAYGAWHCVADGDLPEDGECVICYYSDGAMVVAIYCTSVFGSERWLDGMPSYSSAEVTHWMYPPEAPEESDHGAQ